MNLLREIQQCLRAVRNPNITQTGVAAHYAAILNRLEGEQPALGYQRVSLIKLNEAIQDRWPRGGLNRVKNLAWKLYSEGK